MLPVVVLELLAEETIGDWYLEAEYTTLDAVCAILHALVFSTALNA
jgi:hypothetical protein